MPIMYFVERICSMLKELQCLCGAAIFDQGFPVRSFPPGNYRQRYFVACFIPNKVGHIFMCTCTLSKRWSE